MKILLVLLLNIASYIFLYISSLFFFFQLRLVHCFLGYMTLSISTFFLIFLIFFNNVFELEGREILLLHIYIYRPNKFGFCF